MVTFTGDPPEEQQIFYHGQLMGMEIASDVEVAMARLKKEL